MQQPSAVTESPCGSHGFSDLDVQPLTKDGKPIELSEAGAGWRDKLHRHVTKLGDESITPDTTAAVEECEREVEAEEEMEMEMEEETRLPHLVATGERTWARPGAAMRLASATEVEASQDIVVRFQMHK